MKKCFKKALSGILSAAMLFSSAAINPVTVQAAGFSVAAGWYETIYAEWPDTNPDSGSVSVGYRAKGSADYTYLSGNDLEYLVRPASTSGYGRVDIPGVASGNYELKVTSSDGTTYTNSNIKVYAHDRSGYAHFNYDQGVGAYNNDGTPKDNAIIVYVTEENKNTVEVPGYEGKTWSYTPSSGSAYTRDGKGIGNILNNNMKLVQEVTITDNHPLIIRLIGTVTVPENLTPYDCKDPILGGATGDNGNLAITKYARNVTIEGIGDNTTIDGWGFTFSQTATCPEEAGESYEIRNLTFQNYSEDATAFQGDDAITSPIRRIWVHNNIYYPGYCANPAESDKSEGDGAIDFKRGQYFTLAYNHFVKCHKTGLIGSSEKINQFNMTLHHNWYESVESRQPLAAGGNTHIYNTYYDNSTSVTIDLRGYASCFAEANYFDTCTRPWNLRDSTCRLKLYNNEVVNTKKDGDNEGIIVTASTRAEAGLSDNGLEMPDGGSIANWDTNSTYFYCDSSGNSQVSVLNAAEDVPEYVTTYAGTLHELPLTECGYVNVTVKDNNGNAVTDAAIEASGLTFVNNGDGTYTAQATLGGEYNVTVSKEGFSNVVFTASGFENDGDTVNQTVNLAVDNDGYGVVKLTGGSNNEPVKGATVTLADGTALVDQGDGTYKSSNQIAVGTYNVTITNTGDYIAPTTAQTIVVKTTDAATEIHLDKKQGTVSVTLTAAAGEEEPLDTASAKVYVGDTMLTAAGNDTFTGSVDIKTPYTVTVTVPGWTTDSVTPSTLTAVETSTVSATAVLSYKGTLYTWDYTNDINTEDFFTVSANDWSSIDTYLTFEGAELTRAVKIETITNISFTAPVAGTITLVMHGAGSSVKINGTAYTIAEGANTFDVPEGAVTIEKGSGTSYLYFMQYAMTSGSSSDTSTEATTTTTTETTTAEVVTPSGDGVINQSMTISRGTNDSYVTVYGDLNENGSWKVDKAKNDTINGYIKFTLGNTADVTINGGGEKEILISQTAGDTSGQSLGTGTSVSATGLSAGTWYIYNTQGKITISEIVVTMDSSATESTTTTTTETTTTTTTTETTTESTTTAPIDGVKLTVGEATGTVGNEIIVPVMITGVDTIASYDVNLTFDQALEVVNVTNGNIINNDDFSLSYNYNLAGSLGVAGANPTDEIVAGNNILFYVTFKADTASVYTINLTVDEIYTAQDTKVTAPEITSGKITVEEETAVDPDPSKSTLLGDADGDGDVDKADAAVVLKHISGIAAITDSQYLINADCDGSAGITVADAVWILNYYKANQESTSETTTESTTTAGSSNDWDFSTNSLLSGFAYTSDTKSLSTGDGLTITGSSTSDKVLTDSTGKNYLWYNGSGSATDRNLLITDCKAGDTITVYYGAKSDRTITVTNGTADGEFTKTNSNEVEMGETPVVVTVATDGDVVIYASGQIGYYRIIRTSGNSEASSETTTTTTTETTTAEVVTPSGDGVINQSMTISRGTNDSYVTVNNDKNTSGSWKVDKYNSSSAPGWIEFTLGKAANVAITTGGEKDVYIDSATGASENLVVASGSTTGSIDLEAGTYYIYNTSGNITISEIVVTMGGSTNTTETTTQTVVQIIQQNQLLLI